MISVNDTIRISNLNNLFFGCTGLAKERWTAQGEVYLKVNLEIPGSFYTGEVRHIGKFEFEVTVREFEVVKA